MFAVLEEPRQLTRTTVQAESVLAIDVEHVKRDATLPVNSGVMKIGEAPPWGPTDSVKKIAGGAPLKPKTARGPPAMRGLRGPPFRHW